MDNRKALTTTIGPLIDRHSLGSAGVCALIIVGLVSVPSPLDFPLRASLWCACLSLPVFLAMYVSKNEIIALRDAIEKKGDEAFYLALIAFCFALFLLSASFAFMAVHHDPVLGVVTLFTCWIVPMAVSKITQGALDANVKPDVRSLDSNDN